MAKRAYRGTVQAEVAALTRQRILDAALHCFESDWIEQVTLQQIAADAGVTVQTILRHFNSKTGLLFAVADGVRAATVSERDEVPAGAITAAVDYLVRHYEAVGDRMIRLLAQEERYAPLHDLLEDARSIHRAWTARVFAPYLPTEDSRERLIPQLVATCDVYVWKLLRRDMGLSVARYQATLHAMLNALLPASGDVD
jgi:AcrR family transcriptional regulator